MVERGDIVVQVGTPHVQTLFELSYSVGRHGRVIILEPAPKNLERLRNAEKSLRMDNVAIYPYAAWNEDTNLNSSLAAYAGDHKIDIPGVEMDNDHRPENTYDEEISVEARRLDSLLPEILGDREVDYLEVAVNGAELKVLKGAHRLLVNSDEIRVFAKGHALTESGGPINRPIGKYLKSLSFEVSLTASGDTTTGQHPQWMHRAGNVFAFRKNSINESIQLFE